MHRWLPFFFAFTFVSVVVCLADMRLFPGFFRGVTAVPGLDKAGHFTLMGMLAASANVALRHHRLRIGSLLTGSVIITCIVIAEEFSQQWFPSRTFDWKDLAADMLGIFCASKLSPGKAGQNTAS